MEKIFELKPNADYRGKGVFVLIKSKTKDSPDIKLEINRTSDKMMILENNHLNMKRIKMNGIKKATVLIEVDEKE